MKQIKAKYHTVTSKATSVVALITGGVAEWQWANNDENLGLLQRLQASLQEKVTVDIYQLLTFEAKDMTKRLGETHVASVMKELLALDQPLTALARATEQLMGMHHARSLG